MKMLKLPILNTKNYDLLDMSTIVFIGAVYERGYFDATKPASEESDN